MLDFLRKSSTSFWAWLILLAAAFGLSFGLPSDSLSFGSQPIVEVHGAAVNDGDYRAQLSMVSGFLGVPKDERLQQAMGVKEEILESTIERELLAHAGERMGLASTQYDAEELVVRGHAIVLGASARWTGLGQFNYTAFKNFLAALQIPENRYYALQAREFLARTVRDVVRASVVVGELELRRAYEAEANRLSLRYARYEISEYADRVDPTEADIDAWLDAHVDELRASLETQGARFTKLPEQVRVSIIAVGVGTDAEPAPNTQTPAPTTVQARARLEAARARLEAGEDFRTVARDVSTDVRTARKGGDFGWTGLKVGTGLDPAVDAALRTLTPGTLSGILEGENALYLARIEGQRSGDVPEEDALRELAAEAFAASRGRALARAAAEADRDAVLGGEALTEVFHAPGRGGQNLEAARPAGSASPRASLRESGLFPKTGPIPGLGPLPELVAQAWVADPEAPLLPDVFETSDAIIIAGLESKEEATDEGFAKARDALYTAAWERKGMQVAAGWAQRLCVEAKARGDIVASDEKVARIVRYDVPELDGESAAPKAAYSMCDRVGGQGGLLRAAFMGGGR